MADVHRDASPLAHAALADATALLPFFLTDPPSPLASLPQELVSAPILERQRWLGSGGSASGRGIGGAGTHGLSSTLYGPPSLPSGDALSEQMERALDAFRLQAERTSLPSASSTTSSSSGEAGQRRRTRRAVSALLTSAPLFRRPESGALICALALVRPRDPRAADAGLTLLLLNDRDVGGAAGEDADPDLPAASFKFLNLLPVPLDALPGTWLTDADLLGQNASARAARAAAEGQEEERVPAEYPTDGDDFWAGVDSDSDSAQAKPGARGDAQGRDSDDDDDDDYWAQYDQQEQQVEDGDGNQDGGVLPGLSSAPTGGALPHRSAHQRTDSASATAPDPSPGAASLERTRALLRDAWRSTSALVDPRSHPDPVEARRTLVFTLLADVMGA